jgi:hypothetical protein
MMRVAAAIVFIGCGSRETANNAPGAGSTVTAPTVESPVTDAAVLVIRDASVDLSTREVIERALAVDVLTTSCERRMYGQG